MSFRVCPACMKMLCECVPIKKASSVPQVQDGPREQIEIKSQDGPVHKFYGVIRQKHFGRRTLSADAERDIKEAFFFGFYTAMEFMGKRVPNLDDNVARHLIQEVQQDVNSVIVPAKQRVKSNIILPNN